MCGHITTDIRNQIGHVTRVMCERTVSAPGHYGLYTHVTRVGLCLPLAIMDSTHMSLE